ncbi:MAG: 4Fe-4S dicluster domain-containing protein [Bacteroidetes bacterium]|nr:4Fe-4S dicluster domain-containing protein [Bacteroidota bacterium]MBU1578155.1 4Fe-4S dicluster domain-containing protein [Bacteroidota bacterium]MBU2557571.1 4Fe-4S dicluster domain-containing protein [Bacteroidota bacterium]
MSFNRKEFLQTLLLGTGGILAASKLAIAGVPIFSGSTIKAIVVDYSKCAGCRTCETVCSAFHHQIAHEGQQFRGKGIPAWSNIKVWHYNPPMDVPVTCFLCDDAPCIEACPVRPDKVTGRRALYRDEVLHTIQNDLDRCIGCEQCAEACQSSRGGVIFPDEEGRPNGICDLCQGDPNCVKYCPYDALAFLEITVDMPYRQMQPEKIANQLIASYYQQNLS